MSSLAPRGGLDFFFNINDPDDLAVAEAAFLSHR